MSKTSDYIRGSQRLAIIQKWLNGHEDPLYEVLPTRKEGKYIVKKRETKKEEDKADDNGNNKEVDEPKGSANQRFDDNAADKDVNEEVDDKAEEETEEEEIVYEEPLKPKPKPKPKLRVIPRIDNDNTYLFYQILIQLQRITEILEMNRQDVERDKMIDHMVDEVINAQSKYEKDKDERDRFDKLVQQTLKQVPQPAYQPTYQRRNNVFADMG